MHKENAVRLNQQPILAGRSEEKNLYQAMLLLLDNKYLQKPLECRIHHNHIPDVSGYAEATVHRVLLQGQGWEVY